LGFIVNEKHLRGSVNSKNFRPLTSILLVDDVAPFSRTLRELIELRPEFLVVSEAGDGREAVRLARQYQPEIVILDINLPTVNGFEVARRLSAVAPNAKVIFLSMENSADIIDEAFRLGAEGYVHKSEVFELLSALDAIRKGNKFVSSSLGRRHPRRDQ